MSDSASARVAVLTRLRNAQQTARLPAAPSIPPRPALVARSGQECIERFRAELGALGVDCFLEHSLADLHRRVSTLIESRQVLSWDADLLPYGLGSLLRHAAWGRDSREKQAQAEIGVTGCDAAIAETGSLAMLSGKGKSRAVSLLPPVHLAIVRRDDLCFSMAEFFRVHADRLAAVASCTFITGPSRTADIELTLTLGVHGPGKVIVVIGP